MYQKYLVFKKITLYTKVSFVWSDRTLCSGTHRGTMLSGDFLSFLTYFLHPVLSDLHHRGHLLSALIFSKTKNLFIYTPPYSKKKL